MKVFLSYARADDRAASPVRAALEEAGHEVWVDTEAITGGDRWRAKVVDGIDGCDLLVVLLSRASMGSSNVATEVGLASERRKRIVPARLDGTEPTGDLAYLLANLQRIDLFPDGPAARAGLAAAIEGREQVDPDRADRDQPRPAASRRRAAAAAAGGAALVLAVLVFAITTRDGGDQGDAVDASGADTTEPAPAGPEAETAGRGADGEFCAEARAGSRRLAGADLFGCDLDGADLRGLDLTSTQLGEASLRGADLTGAALIKTDLRGADLTDAIVGGAHLYRAELEGAEGLEALDWSGTLIERSNCDGGPCGFDGAVVINSSLVGCSAADYARGAPIASEALGKELLWQDDDEDCLHDEYERANGILLGNPDTDGDGLVDSIDGHGGDETPLSLFEQFRTMG